MLGVWWVVPALAASWPDRLAKAQGLDELGRVEEIRFTFRASRPGRTSERRWSYRPSTHVVELLSAPPEGLVAPVRYDRDDPVPEALTKVDASFINDSFWFLLPMHLAWAAELNVEEAGPATIPGSSESATLLVVRYPATGGYTPGDRYDLYVDSTDRIVAWAWYAGGKEPAGMVTSWERYTVAGPLTLSTLRRSVDGTATIEFVDVEVR